MNCVVCGKPIEEGGQMEDRHYFHDDDCPNHKVEMDFPSCNMWNDCKCDNPCHDKCCPVCKKEDE